MKGRFAAPINPLEGDECWRFSEGEVWRDEHMWGEWYCKWMGMYRELLCDARLAIKIVNALLEVASTEGADGLRRVLRCPATVDAP